MTTRKRRSDPIGTEGRCALRAGRLSGGAIIGACSGRRSRRVARAKTPRSMPGYRLRGTRWFREAGGMPPSHLAPSAKPPSGRYLSFAEREEIALLRVQGHGVREIARRLGRAPSTLSRELRRNAATRGGGLEYRATTAQWHADRAARRPKPAKLAVNARLSEVSAPAALPALNVIRQGTSIRLNRPSGVSQDTLGRGSSFVG